MMLAYWFRTMGEDGKPTGWVGLAVGRDVAEVMDAIDQHFDPHSVEVIPARKCASFCVRANPKFKSGGGPDDQEESPFLVDEFAAEEDGGGPVFEVGEGLPDFPLEEDKRWKTPMWSVGTKRGEA